MLTMEATKSRQQISPVWEYFFSVKAQLCARSMTRSSQTEKGHQTFDIIQNENVCQAIKCSGGGVGKKANVDGNV